MPANYDPSKDVVKRTRLVDSQFANVKRTRFADGQVLKVKRTRFIPTQYVKRQDFIDDQTHHLDRQRRPHRLLRVSGICEGLTVAVQNSQVTVAPGTALDRQGWLIVLSDPFTVDLQNQTGDVDIFISYRNEGSDTIHSGNDRSASATPTTSGGSAPPRTGQQAAEAIRWLEKPRIEAVKDRSTLKGENPIWLGRVTVSGSGPNQTVALTTMDHRDYSGIYLPSSANPFEAPVLRSGGNPNPKLAVLTGDLRIRGTTADNTAAGLNVTNSNPASTSLLYVRNDGNVGIGTTTPSAKLEVNGNLKVGGTLAVTGNSTLAGSLTVNNTVSLKGSANTTGLSVDPSGNVSMGGTLAVTGNSTLIGSLTVNNTVFLKGSANTTGLSVDPSGDVTMGGTLNFGATVRQMISLWKSGNSNYGIGIQNATQYFRTDKNFAWYKGGAHADGELSPGTIGGTNGTVQMVIKDGNVGIGTTTPGAKLAINGGLHVGGDSDPGDNNLLVDGTLAVTGNSTLSGTLAVTSTSTLTGNVGMGGNLTIAGTSTIGNNSNASFMLAPSDASPNAGYIRFGDQTGWKLHFARSRESSGGTFNAGTTGTLMTIQDNGNVGIGTVSPDSKLQIDKGRLDITASDATGGGQNRFNGLRSPTEDAYRRSQLVLSSGYSDLVIASSYINGLHGSTLTFATYNPDNATQYRKWVINQGNWGDRKQFLEFGYSDANGRANPHDSINDTDTVLTLDGITKRVGIGARTPSERLEVNGNIKVTNATLTGTLAVTGNSTLTGSLTVNNAVSLKGSATGVGLSVDANGNVGIGTTSSPRSALDTGTGVMTGAANDYQKAQFTMSGGGTVSWGGIGGRLKWTARFIAISMERSTTFSVGHVNINQPSRNIPRAQVYDGVARSATADGIILNAWEALYAVHSIGGDQDAVSFKIVRYTDVFIAPSNWILVAVVNEDDRTIKLGTGTILAANSSSTMGSPIPTGTIVMWSGAANAVPSGWALCNGQNGTPDLRSRFIVGAGVGGSPAYNPGDMGEPDQHSHSIDAPPQQVATNSSGDHSHAVPAAWYTSTIGYIAARRNDWAVVDAGGTEARGARVQSEGSHTHVLSVDLSPFPSGSSSGNNRPKWYALCFIMKQ